MCEDNKWGEQIVLGRRGDLRSQLVGFCEHTPSFCTIYASLTLDFQTTWNYFQVLSDHVATKKTAHARRKKTTPALLTTPNEKSEGRTK